MNKAAYVAIGVVALGMLVMMALNWTEKPVAEAPAIKPNQTSTPSKPTVEEPSSSAIQNRDDELTVRAEPAVDLKALGIDPTPFEEMTSDPALIRILATYTPSQIGTVKQAGPNRVELELEGGRRFSATEIGDHRSKANDGTVALDAITTPQGFPIKNIDATDGGITTTGNPSEIWTIDASGNAERLSPATIHASGPVISPNGRHVAFTAQYIGAGALYPKVLMIKDRHTGELKSYAERKHGADYEIAPVDWVEDGRVLRVIEDWGETGGHMQLKQVRVQ